jgi:hypothetical protein
VRRSTRSDLAVGGHRANNYDGDRFKIQKGAVGEALDADLHLNL